MKILFDLECTQPSFSGKRHGAGIYGEIVLRKLCERNVPVVAFYDSAKWLNPEMGKIVTDSPEATLVDRHGKPLQEVFDQSGADRLFSALPVPETLSVKTPRTIGVIHGLRTLELKPDKYFTNYPHTFYQWLRHMAERIIGHAIRKKRCNDYIALLGHDMVVVSNHTAAALRVWLPESTKRIVPVFYSPNTVSDAELDPAVIDGRKYILMVSGNRWEKNVLRAVMAIEKLFDKGLLPDLHVNITGLKKLGDLRYRFRHPERFSALGYVSDEDLGRLYRDAYMFIYPSINEGFGYPPLEAMSKSIPVAASAVCSIPEVCGDAALYFNPYDIEEIANRIVQLADPVMHRNMAERGRKRYEYIRRQQDKDLEALADYICK